MQRRKRWGLPIALGLITAVLLVAVLWPKETPQRTVVIAARDLGAGTTLAAADLATVQMDAARARPPTRWPTRRSWWARRWPWCASPTSR